MNTPPARVVIPNTTKRDALIAIVSGVLVLAFLIYGIVQMSQPITGNKLTGVVISKQATPHKEQLIEFNGRKIEAVKEIDGEFILKVRVEPGARVYEVPVSKAMYESHEKGDSLTFIRPPSEQH